MSTKSVPSHAPEKIDPKYFIIAIVAIVGIVAVSVMIVFLYGQANTGGAYLWGASTGGAYQIVTAKELYIQDYVACMQSYPKEDCAHLLFSASAYLHQSCTPSLQGDVVTFVC